MKTAVDSSVLLDVFGADPRIGESSREALRRAYGSGSIVACEIVWAEVRAYFRSDADFLEAVGSLGLLYEPISAKAAALAGRFWRDDRKSNPARRDRVVADFLVAAHATQQTDRLLSRDRGFYRKRFKGLEIVDPSQ